jgi:hypothetical protein
VKKTANTHGGPAWKSKKAANDQIEGGFFNKQSQV